MAQFSWTYPDEKGGQHNVGIYHGDNSGHFVLYCNSRVITIDFKVFESKTYSFFIEEELCELFLIKQKDGSFEYDLKVNTEIDTPSNQIRKETKKSNWKKTLTFFCLFFLCIIGGSIWTRSFLGNKRMRNIFGTKIHYNGSKYEALNLQLDGKLAECTITLGANANAEKCLFYTFPTFNGSMYNGEMVLPKSEDKAASLYYLPNGFPAENGAIFYVKYDPKDPSLHVLNFMQPNGTTLVRYMELAIKAEVESEPDLLPLEVVCRVQLIGREVGLEGLALLLHAKSDKTSNPDYNKEARTQMLAEPNLAALLKKTCVATVTQ